MSGTYKLTVPEEVEAKIRYLIRKFPHNEWSGVLFTTHTGTFEGKDLVITCKDIYPMATGSGTWTEFNMSEDVASYMAQHIELFDSDLALVHSHHTMGAWFSGQDLFTLQDQGNDKNCFISLIVDTQGKYVAAITRKVITKKEVVTTIKDKSYMFFGEGEVHFPVEDKVETREVEDTVIEYYMLDVERHTVEEPLAYLDERFEEIEARNKQQSTIIPQAKGFRILEDAEEWQNSHATTKTQLDLFGSVPDKPDTKGRKALEGEDTPSPVDLSSFVLDQKAVHEAVARILCCSLIVNAEKVDLRQWVSKNMVKVYRKLFEEEDGNVSLDTPGCAFTEYADNVIEWVITHFQGDMDIKNPDMVDDTLTDTLFYAVVAQNIENEMLSYGSNKYIQYFCTVLEGFVDNYDFDFT